MRNKYDRHILMLELLNSPYAALLKEKIADRHRFTADQDLGIHVNRHGESKSNEHTAGVGLHRPIDEISYFGKFFNRRNAFTGLRVGKSQNRRIEEDVLTPGELGIEPGAKLQQ